ncbi:G-protein coupled GABA receptor [Fragilaria crotonensis]|nr:G-protein coupled GABA receptor [Fragilaria crotonensis]
MTVPEYAAVLRLNETTRLAHIPIILTFAYPQEDGSFAVEPWDLYPSLGAFLAFKHFNDRNPEVLPHLPHLLEGCDIQLTTEIYDSHGSPVEAARLAIQIILEANHSIAKPDPMAIVGCTYSRENKAVAVMTGVYGVPHITPFSGSTELDNGATFPTFARIIPNDQADARLVVHHMRSLGVTNFGVIHVHEEQGINYAKHLHEAGAGMSITTVSFEPSDPKSMEAAIQTLKAANLKYFYGLALGEDEQLLRSVAEAGITGPGYFWMMNDTGLDGKEFDADDPIVEALNGIGYKTMDPDVTGNMETNFMGFQFDSELQEEFISAMKNLDRKTFSDFNLTENVPEYSWWVTLSYDAIIASGLAACSIQKEIFTNIEFFEAVTNVEFDGASGKVRLDPKTQSRDVNTVRYALMNMLTDSQGSVGDKLRFQARVASHYDLSSSDKAAVQVTPFIFADNSTTPPDQLPPLEVDQSLIGQGIRISGLVLCGLTILNAVGWMLFTRYYRRSKVIRGSQPPFLYMLCVGVIVMATSIIPMGLQEPVSKQALDVACMSQLWLLSAGFTTIFSALFCKLWRLNKLLASAKRFKRVQIEVKDVLYPFAILLVLNFTLLAVWTAVDPLRWVRGDLSSYDTYGRVTKTAGSCACESQTNQTIFYVFFFLLNASALVIANWQSYLSRNYETEVNEHESIAISMLMLTEAAVLGLPVLFLVKNDAGAFFLVRTILIVITSVGVLLPIFLPKVSLRNQRKFDRKRSLRPSSSLLEGPA